MMMRRLGLAIIFSAFLSHWGFSQSQNRFHELYSTGTRVNEVASVVNFEEFISSLAIKRSKIKSDETFVRYIFRESHKQFLKEYSAYVPFPEIFESGKYDCLTATSFLSLVLDEFHIEYSIVETNYHIFLIVEVENGRVLLETTDRVNGVVTGEQEIAERLTRYNQNLLATSDAEKYYYQYSAHVYQTVKAERLPGLLYYNKAVVAFNEARYDDCVIAIKLAARKYYSPRISELASLVVKSVANSELTDTIKKSIVKQLIPYTHLSFEAVAAR